MARNKGLVERAGGDSLPPSIFKPIRSILDMGMPSDLLLQLIEVFLEIESLQKHFDRDALFHRLETLCRTIEGDQRDINRREDLMRRVRETRV